MTSPPVRRWKPAKDGAGAVSVPACRAGPPEGFSGEGDPDCRDTAVHGRVARNVFPVTAAE